jgi:hypothetical protein
MSRAGPESFDGIRPGDRVRISNWPFRPAHHSGQVKRLETAMTHPGGSPKWVFAIIVSDLDGSTIESPTEHLSVITTAPQKEQA